MKLLTIISDGVGNPIADVTELLSKHDIDIRDIDFNQMGGESFLSLAVSEYDKSLELLVNAGFRAISNDIVLLRAEDRPGALAEIARNMAENSIEIRSLTLVNTKSQTPVVAVATSDNEKVRSLYASQVVN